MLVDNQTRLLQRPTADGVASCYAGVAFGVWIWHRRGSGPAVTYAGAGANASPSYVGDVCEQFGRASYHEGVTSASGMLKRLWDLDDGTWTRISKMNMP